MAVRLGGLLQDLSGTDGAQAPNVLTSWSPATPLHTHTLHSDSTISCVVWDVLKQLSNLIHIQPVGPANLQGIGSFNCGSDIKRLYIIFSMCNATKQRLNIPQVIDYGCAIDVTAD